MMEKGFEDRWGIDTSPVLNAKIAVSAAIQIVRIRRSEPERRVVQLFDSLDAYFVGIQLAPLRIGELGLGRRTVAVPPWSAGSITIVDLHEEPRGSFASALDALIVMVPYAALLEVAREQGAPRVVLPACFGVLDTVVAHLGASLLPALDAPDATRALFVDHVGHALLTHLAHRYGGALHPAATPAGALAPWQLRRATEMIDAHLAAPLSLAQLAEACSLSRGYFVRAFRRSTGTSPFRWLLQRRIERAEALLRWPAVSLSEVAQLSGFASQASFTRSFARAKGTSPGAFRRANAK